jgi:hypothetical protein
MVVAMPWKDSLDNSEDSEVHDQLIDLNPDRVDSREVPPKKVTTLLEEMAANQGDTANSSGSAWFRAVATVLCCLDPGQMLHRLGNSFAGRLLAACLLEGAGDGTLTVQMLALS